MRGRAYAWANLGVRFGLHLLRLPLRPWRRGRDFQRFVSAVVPEGYVPFSPQERASFPAFLGCIHCGLCSLACPALRETAASGWSEPWTFVAGPSRSVHQAALVAGELAPCTRCDACAAVCPTAVPIPWLAAVLERLAQAGARQYALAE